MVMLTPTPSQVALLAEAAENSASMRALAEQETRLRHEREDIMRRMFKAGLSWAEIGRQFGCTPQAAMYATGHATRTKRT